MLDEEVTKKRWWTFTLLDFTNENPVVNCLILSTVEVAREGSVSQETAPPDNMHTHSHAIQLKYNTNKWHMHFYLFQNKEMGLPPSTFLDFRDKAIHLSCLPPSVLTALFIYSPAHGRFSF